MSYCTNCGHALGVGRFCTNCGAPAETPAVSQTTPAVGTDREDSGLTDTAERRRPIVPLPSGPHPPSARYPLYADTPLGPPPSAPPPASATTTAPAAPAPAPADYGDRPRRGWLWPALLGSLALLVIVASALTVLWITNDDPAAPDPAGDQAGTTDEGRSVDAGSSPTEDITGEVSSVEVPGTAGDSEDARTGETVTFDAENLTDDDATTAWRIAGDATGADLVIDFAGPVELREIGLINGYAKSYPGYDGYRVNRRVLSVTWTFDDGTSVEQELSEQDTMQMIPIDAVSTEQVVLTLDEVSAPGAGPSGKDFTAISDLRFGGVAD
ncbi:hypothetical protein FXB39_14650 [Nocardioides sp. BGMRC 2183]|nr:hypothetical protein FXB39_14650 [Nocardioides sp. BGMRC 2183]